MQPSEISAREAERVVSILTGLERPVQHPAEREIYRFLMVSILTGLERPVQRGKEAEQWELESVSILTGLERPVQREQGRPAPAHSVRFNPHRP